MHSRAGLVLTVGGEPLSAAIVGCGKMGAWTPEDTKRRLTRGWLPVNHAEALSDLDGVEIVALCDVDPEQLAKTGTRYGVEQRYLDYRQLIDDCRPDILSIATRTPQRAEILTYAALGGVRGIHCEKPIANSVARARSLVDLIQANDVKLSYGTTRRFMEAYRRARELMDSEIGELVHIAIDHGRTTLLWNHPHSVDLILYFAGARRVRAVQARCQMRGGLKDWVIDDDPVLLSGSVIFEDDVIGHISSVPGFHSRVSGLHGSVAVLSNGTKIEVERQGHSDSPNPERQCEPCEPKMSGTQTAFSELAHAIRTDGTSPICPRAVLAGMMILIGFVQSSLQDSRLISLDELEPISVTGRSGGLYA